MEQVLDKNLYLNDLAKIKETIKKNQSPIRLLREGVVVFEGKLASLQREKDQVKEVKAGFECGLLIDGFNDIKEGDIVEGYEMVEVD